MSDGNFLSEDQERMLNILGMISSTLSIMGSGLILGRIFRCKSYVTPYNRIMIGLSSFDVITSFAVGFGPLLLPSETSTRVWAFGNDMTCNFIGFLTQLGIGGIWYNGLLSFYYLSIVRFRVKQQTFAQKYEKWLHISAVLYFLATATSGLVIGIYQESDLGQACWIGGDYPENCEDDPNIDCSSDIIGWLFGGIPLLLVFLGLPVSNFVIYRFVRRTMGETQSDDTAEVSLGRSNQSPPTMYRKLQRDHVREVAQQGFLYVGSFYVSYFPVFVIRVVASQDVQREKEADIFWLLILYSTLYPLQGFMNLIIYMRPNFTRIRKACPEMGILWAVKVSFLEKKLPTLQQSHAIAQELNSAQVRQQRQNDMMKPITEEEEDSFLEDDDRVTSGGLFSFEQSHPPQGRPLRSIEDKSLKTTSPSDTSLTASTASSNHLQQKNSLDITSDDDNEISTMTEVLHHDDPACFVWSDSSNSSGATAKDRLGTTNEVPPPMTGSGHNLPRIMSSRLPTQPTAAGIVDCGTRTAKSGHPDGTVSQTMVERMFRAMRGIPSESNPSVADGGGTGGYWR